MRVMLLAICLLLSFVAGISCRVLESDVITQAHRCCVSSCSAQEKDMMERQLEVYSHENGANAYNAQKYVDLANSGEACSSNSRAKRSNYVTVAGPSGPYDVANSDVQFNYTVNVNLDCGIYTFYIYAYTYFNNTQSRSIYPTDYSYYDSGANATTIRKNVTFIIPRYSFYGNWTVTAYAYCSGYTAYTSATAYFVVNKTVNDVKPPVLTSLYAAVMNYNDTNDRTIGFTATDDVSGVYQMYLYIGNSTNSNLAYASFVTQYVNGQYVGYTSISAGVTDIYFYSTLSPGTYDIIAVYLYDVTGSSTSYSTTQLKALGFQSSIIIAQGNCKAGRKLAYGASGNCTLCDKGTFSGFGAFRCKACLAGTASNVAGATSCVTCPAGTSSIGGSAGCDPCPAGTYSYAGAAECTPCWSGYNSTEGSDTCTPCPTGTYSVGGLASCLPCPAGSASSSYTSWYCNPCAPGQYQPNPGQGACLTCPQNTFSWVGAVTCQQCPSPTVNGPAGSNSRLNCYQS